MKKLLLSIGSITSVVAPIAAVISCSSDDIKLPELPKPGSPGNIASVDLSTELAKFADATSTLDETTMQAAITAGTLTTSALGFNPTSTLTSGVTATFAVKTTFAGGKVVLTVTLAKGTETVSHNTKDITITAKPAAVVTPTATDLTSEIAKFTDVTSTLYDIALATNTAATTSVVDATKLGITTPSTLASGLTASYAVKTPFAINKTAVITVTLTKDDGTAVTNNTKDITVTAKVFDYSTATSAVQAAAAGLGLPDATVMGDVSSTLTGTKPVLADGVVAGYKIATATDHATSATHDVIVSLSNPLTTKTTQITISVAVASA